MSHLEKIPAILNKRVFQKVFQIAEISNLSKEEKEMYDSNLKARWDYENSISFAKEEAAKKARHEEAVEIARKFKEMGVIITDIAKGTGLSVEEIEKL